MMPSDRPWNFKVLREYLGGSEVIDLGTNEGWSNWAEMIVQDYDAAEELAERVDTEGEVIVNDTEPEFIERYTKLDEADAQALAPVHQPYPSKKGTNDG